MTFKIASGPNQVELAVHGYEQSADSRDRYDLNWLRAEVSVQSGSFRAHESIAILTWDLGAFLKESLTLQKTLTGAATFQTLEEQVELQLKGNGRGHIHLTGKVSTYQNKLTFQFDLDQTDLGPAISRLKQITTAFPKR